MNNFEYLKQIYDNYDLIGGTVHSERTGTYSDANTLIFKQVLFANVWVSAMNIESDNISVEKAFDSKSNYIYNMLMNLEEKNLNSLNRILTKEELQRLAHFYLPYNEISNIINYLYANENLLDTWIKSGNIKEEKKLVRLSN